MQIGGGVIKSTGLWLYKSGMLKYICKGGGGTVHIPVEYHSIAVRPIMLHLIEEFFYFYNPLLSWDKYFIICKGYIDFLH